MTRCKPIILQKTLLFSGVCIFLGFLSSCSSTEVNSKKTPSSDLWMYHTYSWSNPKAQGVGEQSGTQSSSADLEQQVRAQANVDLAKRGFTHLSPESNPDFWIVDQVSSQGVRLEFKDARTGKTVWQGQATLKRGVKTLTADGAKSSVDQLIGQYIASREWKDPSFWYTGIHFEDIE